MVLDRIQAHLQAIYGLSCELKASDFLLDAAGAKALGSEGRSDEELLVHHDGEELGLGLYLAPSLLEKIARFEDEPHHTVDAQLGAFCEVAEGVSHFLYVHHTAEEERTVSLLELEAQAEVDKFAACALVKWRGDPRELVKALFDRVTFRSELSTEERWRYGEANRLAKNYVRRLLPLITARRLDGLLGELRKSYRLGAEAKLQYFGR